MDRLVQTLGGQLRMSNNDSLTLINPDKAFTNVPPLPRSWPEPISRIPSQTTGVSVEWKEAKEFERSHVVLSRFQIALRSVHKRKVAWPADESTLSDLPSGEYLKALLQPTAALFSQLRSVDVIKKPVECISIDFDESIYGATFSVETNFLMWRGTPPIVLALYDKDLLDSDGKASSHVEYALSKVLQHKPSVTTIIVTNYNQIIIFCSPEWNRPKPTFEKILTDKPSLALRVLSAAYLYKVSPSYSLINVPPPVVEVNKTLILPEGPTNDPSLPLLSDEELFMTYHRHSNFDLATLVRNHDRALQFFRWKDHIQKKYSNIVAHSHDTLTGATNNAGNLYISANAPIYPYDPSEIPADTAEHLKFIQRESPLVSCGIADSFQKSKAFTLEIHSVIAEVSERGFCTVYRCQLTSIDNKPLSCPSPSLCLKLFDDRFQALKQPNPLDKISYEVLHWWFDGLVIAEEYALNESLAYDKLRPVQGSIVPWFYGMHQVGSFDTGKEDLLIWQFTLPTGIVLYGLLMEFIDGSELTPEFAHQLSVDRQIKMIKNCRHAARILDVADVAQQDWHSGQILIHTKPQTDIDHAVLIDFGLTAQTWYIDEPIRLENYWGVLQVLSQKNGDVGMDWQFTWRHFGEPDDWDPILASRPKSTGGLVILKARDIFPYISSA